MTFHQFCRDKCLDRGEPLPGSGVAAQRYVLLHWPRRHWRVPRTSSQEMPEVLSRAILFANDLGIHVALVDGDDTALSFDGKSMRVASAEVAAKQLEIIASGGLFEGEGDDRVTILCCTDSKQDPCCARFGFETWKALRDLADPEKFRVLQSTHLGGCRFAASLVVLPARQRYGRLEPKHVPHFLDCLAKGFPYLPAYRGNPVLDSLSQVAEHAALSFAANHNVFATISLKEKLSTELKADEAEFVARAASMELRIRLKLTRFEVNTRCNTIEAGIAGEADRWRVVTIERIN